VMPAPAAAPAFGGNPATALPPMSPIGQGAAPAVPSASAPASPAGSSVSSSQPSVPIVAPDDLTPDEVANAFAAGGSAPADAGQTSSDVPADTTPTLPDAAAPINPSSNVSSARDAVAQAISGNATPSPEPIQALNANPLNLSLGADATNPGGLAPAVASLTDPLAPVGTAPPPSAPVQPWVPPTDTAMPQPTAVPNPATQFNPAAFNQDDDSNAPPPVPPPMMPQMPAT
jgi:hypothetical protein